MSQSSRNTGEFQDEVEARVELLINRGLERFQSGDLPGAIAEWEHALLLESDNQVVRQYLDHVRKRHAGQATRGQLPGVSAYEVAPTLDAPELELPELELPELELPELEASAAEVDGGDAPRTTSRSAHVTLPGRPIPPEPASRSAPGQDGPRPSVADALTTAERRQLEAASLRDRVVPMPPPDLDFEDAYADPDGDPDGDGDRDGDRDDPGYADTDPGYRDVVAGLAPAGRGRTVGQNGAAGAGGADVADDDLSLRDTLQRGEVSTQDVQRQVASEFADHLPTRSDGLVAVETEDDVGDEFDGDASTGALTSQVERRSLGFVRATGTVLPPSPFPPGTRLGSPALVPLRGDETAAPSTTASAATSERSDAAPGIQRSSPSPQDPHAAFDLDGDASDPFGFEEIELDQADAARSDPPLIVAREVAPDGDDVGGDAGDDDSINLGGDDELDEYLDAHLAEDHGQPDEFPVVLAPLTGNDDEDDEDDEDPEDPAERAPTLDNLDVLVARLAAEIEFGLPRDDTPSLRLRHRLEGLVRRALVERDDGNYPLAVGLLDMLFSEEPSSAITQKVIQRHRDVLIDIFQHYLGNTGAVPRLAVPMDELPVDLIDSRAAFLISRLDGMMTLDELLDVSGMSRIETYRYLCKLRLRGIVALG